MDEDTDGLFSFSQPARLTIQWPGSYDVYAAVWWDADATGRRILDILHNGGPTILARDEPAASGWNAVNGPALSASTSWTFAAGDYVEAQLFQTSGGPLNHAPFTAFAPVLAVKWTGP